MLPVGGVRALVRSTLERLGLVSAPPGDNAYHAFISYSHAVDGALAPALQRGLQRFAKPWHQARAVRIFRDEASLSANPGLWTSIAQALDSSLFFILLASPRAAASPWVAREAAQWRSIKPLEHLLVGLTEGELVWDEVAGDFDWERTTALPETLRGAFQEEPRYIDLRWAHAGEQLSLSHARFRDAIAELAAPLHGVPKDVLAGEEVRQHRRTVRIARTAVVIFACLTLASIFFGIFALRQANEARRQRDLATSRSLLQAAASNLEGRIDLTALLSLEAYRLRPSAETKSSLIRAIERSEHIVGLLHADQPVDRIAVDADGARLAAAGTQNVVLWNLGPPRRPNGMLPVRGARALAFRPDGEILAVGEPSAISLWALEGRRRMSRRIPFRGAIAIAFSESSRLLNAVGPTSVAVFDTRSGRRIRRTALGMSVSAAAFAPGGTLVAIGGLRALSILDLTGKRPPVRIAASETPLALAFDSQGKRVAGVDLRGDGATIWDTATGDVLERLPLRGTAETVVFGPQDQLVLGMADGSVELRTENGSPSSQVLRGPAERVFDIEFPRGGPLATAGEQGVIVLWDPAGSAFQRQLPPLADPISDADFAARASALAVGGFGEVVTIWSFESGRPLRRVLRTGPVSAVAIDGAGSRVAVADRGVVLYEADGARRDLQPAGARALGTLEFGDGNTIAWGMPGRVSLWDVVSGRRVEPLAAVGTPLGLDFSGEGNLLAVAGEQGATLWDVTDRRSTELIGGQAVSAVAISRSGRVVAAATHGEVVVMDAEQGSTRFVLQIPQGLSVKLSFAPDEKTLAVGTSEARLVLVDAENGWQLGALSVPGGPVFGLDFSSDGATLLTAAQGGLITLWDDLLWSDVRAMTRRLCSVAGRSLTPDEWREFVPGQSYRTTCP